MGVMDYLYTLDNEKILIETVQKQTRTGIIQQYKNCRKIKNITQAELSKLTGISQPNVTRFESGNYNPSLEMMVKMAEALGMELRMELVEKKPGAAPEDNY